MKKSPPPNISQPFEASYSKLKGTLVLLLFFGLSASLIPIVLASFIVAPLGFAFSSLTIVAWAIFFLPLGIMGYKAFANDGPVIIIDHKGITDTRLTPSFAPWEHIGRIAPGSKGRRYWLRIGFRTADIAKAYVKHPERVRPTKQRVFMQNDWNPNYCLMNCSRAELFNAAHAFHKQAMRQNPATAHRPRFQNIAIAKPRGIL